jgi:SP family general alpha glucoside:H+ symporter-like MFS transporter
MLSIIWAYFRQPEMRGRTYGELDTLFEQRVSARKFRTTVVNQFHDDGNTDASDRQTVVGDEKLKEKGQGRTEQWVEGEMPRGTA